MLSYSVRKGLYRIKAMRAIDTVCGTWKVLIIHWFCQKTLKIDSYYLCGWELLIPHNPTKRRPSWANKSPSRGLTAGLQRFLLYEHGGWMQCRVSPRTATLLLVHEAQPQRKGNKMEAERDRREMTGCALLFQASSSSYQFCLPCVSLSFFNSFHIPYNSAI